MLTYFLLALTWFAIVFLPPYLAYRRPSAGQMSYGDNAADSVSEAGSAR